MKRKLIIISEIIDNQRKSNLNYNEHLHPSNEPPEVKINTLKQRAKTFTIIIFMLFCPTFVSLFSTQLCEEVNQH